MNAKLSFASITAAVVSAYGERAPRTELELFDALRAVAEAFEMEFPDGERERFADQAARVARAVKTTVRGSNSRTTSAASCNTVWRSLLEHAKAKGTPDRIKELRKAHAAFRIVARFAAGVTAIEWEGEE